MKRLIILLLFLTTTLSAETLFMTVDEGIMVLSDSTACRSSFEGAHYFKSGIFYIREIKRTVYVCWRRENTQIIIKLLDKVINTSEVLFEKL